MRKFSGLQRLLSLILCAALLLGNLAGITMKASAAETAGPIVDKVADPATVNDWEKYFSMTDTSNAGGVWTDKSVFLSAAEYLAATHENENAAAAADLAISDPYSFLVALSAIASSKSIDGYSNIPTDTILILDVSGSMSNSGSDDEMVNAANQAIDTLLKLNEHNRVGVVLYSNTSATMLPLDRYTAGDTYTSTTYVENPDWYPGSWEDRYIANTTTYQEYLKFSNHTISIGDRLTNSAGNTVTGNSRNVTGGTYIQSGLDEAMDIFLAAETKITGDVIQAGTIRMPVTVLMTDGDPTYGTTAYANIGDREFGNGSDSSNELGFVTQMTAAYLKAKVEEHYNRSSLFYTLGLGVGSGSVAESVLDPAQSNSTISGYWDEFLADGSADWTTGGRNETTLTVSRPSNDTIALEDYAGYEHYVTEYFPASSADALNAAFQSIVDAITLQSMYYPTRVQGHDFDNSGFLEFRDYIGEGMEVKSVKGVQWGEILHTGKDFAYTVKYNMGTVAEPTEEGNELVWAVMDRLGITDAQVARDLLQDAWNAGQLAYNDENPNNVTYSNYIGWYAAQDGAYLGFWNGDENFADAPSGAFQAVKCYFVLGDVGDGHRATDMLYASIQVRTTIATGEQIVYGRLPASLIPLIQYNISLNAADPLRATEITMDVTGTTPSRLIYEVGLSSDVDVNTLEPGTHEFYTNQWESEIADGDDPSTAHNTFVSFQPSSENERYVYHENMPIYVKQGDAYVRYTGSDAPISGEYYRAHLVYSATGAGNEAEITVHYEQIPAQALSAETVAQTDSGWVVKKGTIYRYTVREEVAKAENATGTLGHSEHPLVHLEPEYHLDAILGNNGKLTIVITPPKKVYNEAGNDIDGQMVMIGDVLTYEITAYNYEDTAADIIITDTVPAGTTYVEGSAGNGVVNAATGAITWTIKNVPAGESVSVSFQVTVTEAAIDEINNTAYINVGNNPAYTTNTTTNPPAGKTSESNAYTVEGEVQVGDLITYSIHYYNDSADTAQITIVDTIPVGTIYVDGSATYGGTESLVLDRDSNGVVTGMTWTISNVPAGASGSVNFQVYVGPDAVSPVENTATIQIGDRAPIISTNTVEDDLAYGDLMLTKTVAAGNAAGSADKYFTLQLYSGVEGVASLNGTFAVTGSSKVTEITFTNGHASIQIKDGEQITIQDLPAGITVSVYEEAAAGYTPGYSANEVTVLADNAVRLDVTNTYNVSSTSVTLEGTKTLSGRTLANEEFSFIVLEDGVVVTTGENLADGTIVFKPITYTQAGVHTYTVKEVNGGEAGMTYDTTEFTVTVTVTDDGAGNLVATVEYPTAGIAFHNVHTPDPVDLVLEGTKTLAGRELLDREFSFIVLEGSTVVTTGENLADGTIVFKPITYTEAGEHTYTVKEVASGPNGIAFDAAEFTVTVSVTVNSQGELDVAVTYPDDGIAFENSYEAEPVSVTLVGTKVLTGRDLRDGEFSFLVHEGSTLVTTGENLADGTIVFKPITYTEAGTHTYTITEVGSAAGGVSYDQTVYTVTVTVTDNTVTGKLEATVTYPTGGVVFTNIYDADDTSVILEGTKVLDGRPMTDNEFSFVVTDSEGNVVSTGLSKADDTIVFTPISYSAAGTFTYTVTEVQGHLKGVTYDAASFTVQVTVVDNVETGELEASVVYTDGDIVFENVYTPDPISITPTGTKELTGREMKDNEFSFLVTDSNGNVVSTGLSKADGTIVFTEIGYTAADIGTHVYTVSEVKGNLGGVTYTNATFEITVEVIHNKATGKLEATVTYPAGDVKFVNKYTVSSTSYTPVGTKELTGREMRDNEFSFVVMEGDTVVSTGLSKADGTIAFTPISYTAAGVHVYTVKEVRGNLGGVSYSTVSYTLTVTVEDDGNGNLVATAIDPPAIVFQNTYSTTSVDVQLHANKTLIGKELADGAFTFILMDENGKTYEATNTADGQIIFETLTFSSVGVYTYTVTEQAGTDGRYTYDSRVYTVIIDVRDNGNGQLYAAVTYHLGAEEVGAVHFYNSYVPAPVTLDLNDRIDFVKTVKDTADSGYSPAGFTFEVYNWDGDLVASGVSDENGYIDLEDDLVFTTAGEYHFRVVEKTTDKAGVTIDTTVWAIHVVVVYDNASGLLSISDVHAHEMEQAQSGDIEAQNGVDEVVFENIYDPEDITVTIPITKKLHGRDLKAGEFTFQLFEGTKLITQATNDKDGNVTFTVAYDKIGTYTYTVREVQGTLGGVTYDLNGYEIVVVVTDAGGKLEATITSEAVTFNNQYVTKPATFVLKARKVLEGRDLSADEFFFHLTGENVHQTKSNAADGQVTFDAIELSEPGTYVYTVTETVGTLAGVTYSDLVYTATVTVTDDGVGHLIAAVEYSLGQETVAEALFTNVYQAQSVEVALKATKALSGRTQENGEFTFELIDENGGINTATNNENGVITIESFEFTQAGTYTYTLREVQGDKGGVTYDPKEYEVKIIVTDNYETGKLEAVVTVDGIPVTADEDGAYDLATFNNSYAANPVTVALAAVKNLTGRDLVGGEFTFILTDGEDTTITVTSDADGFIDFGSLTYTAVGTYAYTLTEILGDLPGVTYDEAPRSVTVYVTDNRLGQLEARVVVGDAEITADNQGIFTLTTFENSYEAAPVDVTVEADKDLTGRDLEEGEFEFVLVGEGETYTAKNDAEGNISFNLHFAEVGTYTYVMSEIRGDLGGVTYDDAQYNVTIEVTDNTTTGKLEAVVSIDGEAVFHNTYTAAPVELTIEAEKTLTGRDLVDGEFTFQLTDEAGQSLTAANDGWGNVRFDLTYQATGIYTYTLAEVKGEAEHVTYDETVYTVQVVVADDGVGSLYIDSVAVDGSVGDVQISFQNFYNIPEIPKTGDESNFLLYGMLMLGSITALAVLLLGKKKELFN